MTSSSSSSSSFPQFVSNALDGTIPDYIAELDLPTNLRDNLIYHIKDTAAELADVLPDDEVTPDNIFEYPDLAEFLIYDPTTRQDLIVWAWDTETDLGLYMGEADTMWNNIENAIYDLLTQTTINTLADLSILWQARRISDA